MRPVRLRDQEKTLERFRVKRFAMRSEEIEQIIGELEGSVSPTTKALLQEQLRNALPGFVIQTGMSTKLIPEDGTILVVAATLIAMLEKMLPGSKELPFREFLAGMIQWTVDHPAEWRMIQKDFGIRTSPLSSAARLYESELSTRVETEEAEEEIEEEESEDTEDEDEGEEEEDEGETKKSGKGKGTPLPPMKTRKQRQPKAQIDGEAIGEVIAKFVTAETGKGAKVNKNALRTLKIEGREITEEELDAGLAAARAAKSISFEGQGRGAYYLPVEAED